MRLTDEQEAILRTNHNIVINAVAGSGKTTTLIEYARTRPSHKRILYLAFNRSVKMEAEQKFAAAGLQHVTVETAHSLAFDHVVKMNNYTISPGYKGYELVDLLQIATGDRHVDFMIGSHVNRFISYFCNSTVARVQELQYLDVVSDAKAKQFAGNYYGLIEQYTRYALAKMDKGVIPIIHDFYLKKFQLSQPQLSYDYILFDEGQDASGAMLDVFLKQPAIKIIVGDVHQQIYGWRFAINSLLNTDFPVFNLSKSFRFDNKIALVANTILAWKNQLQQPPAVKVIGAGTGTGKTITQATLARTNLSLLLNAIAQWQDGKIKKVYFEGKMNSYMFADEGASLYDVLNLYNGKPDKIRDKLIAGMKDMKELEDYIEKTEDNSLNVIVDVVKEFGNSLPRLVNQLRENEVGAKEDADMIFSTVHRCKGMEYDNVTLLNDFITEEKLKRYITEKGGDKISDLDRDRLSEEVNILYVAATRARKKLVMPDDINPLKVTKKEDKPSPKKRLNWRIEMDIEDHYSPGRDNKSTYTAQRKTANQGKFWSRDEDQQLTELFHASVSLTQIAAQMQRSHGSIHRRLQKLGLISEYDNMD